jgi:hypothetical protein
MTFGRNFSGVFASLPLEKPSTVMRQLTKDASGFFKNVLNDKFVQKYISETPGLAKMASNAGETAGKVYPEVYDMLSEHNNGILDLAKMYIKTLSMKPDARQLELAKASALAHDIGKTFASPKIWNQPGKPEPYLQHFINNHGEIGSEITRRLGAPEEVNIFTKLHHSGVGKMETELINAKVQSPCKMADIFEAMKGADIRQALRAENDPLRMYRKQPLNWFKTYKCLDEEIYQRQRLRPDVFRAIAVNDFGIRPTKQHIYNKLSDDFAKGNFEPEDMRDYLVRKFGIKEAADLSNEGVLQMCTNILHNIVS